MTVRVFEFDIITITITYTNIETIIGIPLVILDSVTLRVTLTYKTAEHHLYAQIVPNYLPFFSCFFLFSSRSSLWDMTWHVLGKGLHFDDNKTKWRHFRIGRPTNWENYNLIKHRYRQRVIDRECLISKLAVRISDRCHVFVRFFLSFGIRNAK